jgi:hypothetical protein
MYVRRGYYEERGESGVGASGASEFSSNSFLEAETMREQKHVRNWARVAEQAA